MTSSEMWQGLSDLRLEVGSNAERNAMLTIIAKALVEISDKLRPESADWGSGFKYGRNEGYQAGREEGYQAALDSMRKRLDASESDNKVDK